MSLSAVLVTKRPCALMKVASLSPLLLRFPIVYDLIHLPSPVFRFYLLFFFDLGLKSPYTNSYHLAGVLMTELSSLQNDSK